MDNRPELLDMDKFAEYLGQAPCPQLVFLNACCSGAHAQILHEVGVPCVIGTEDEVDDEIATEFAEGFYRAIVDGETIGKAFDKATLNIEMRRREDGEPRKLFRGHADWPQDARPWRLYPEDRRGADWRLGDPFGPRPKGPSHPWPQPDENYRSEHYVERNLEQRAVDALSRGTSVTVYGVERFGKTWFLRRIIERMPDACWIEPRLADCPPEARADFDAYFKCLAHQLCEALAVHCQDPTAPYPGPGPLIDEIWREPGGPQGKLERVLSRYASSKVPSMILACDDVDAILPSENGDGALEQPVARDFIRLLNSWIQAPEMPRFLFTVSTTADRLDRILKHSSPFARTHELTLEDLGAGKLTTLADKYGLDIDSTQVQHIEKWIGGHPYLVGIALDYARTQGASLMDIEPDWFQHHIDRLGLHLRRARKLKDALQQVCAGNSRLDDEDLVDDLRKVGLIQGKQGSLEPRNALYQYVWGRQ